MDRRNIRKKKSEKDITEFGLRHNVTVKVGTERLWPTLIEKVT